MEEIWKDVIGYEGLYAVSNIGRVKALKKTFLKKNSAGIISNFRLQEKLMRLNRYFTGYDYVQFNVNNKRKNFGVHRLVAMAFIPNLHNKPQVNHINAVRNDNRVENLEWVSASENINHAFAIGTHNNYGINHKNSKLTENDISEIRRSKLKGKELSDLYKVNVSCISKIKNRLSWKRSPQPLSEM